MTSCCTNRSWLNIDHACKIIFHRWSLLKPLLSLKLPSSLLTTVPGRASWGARCCQLCRGSPRLAGHSQRDPHPPQQGERQDECFPAPETSRLQPGNRGWLCCPQTRARSVVELAAAPSSLTAWQLRSASGTVRSLLILIHARKTTTDVPQANRGIYHLRQGCRNNEKSENTFWRQSPFEYLAN